MEHLIKQYFRFLGEKLHLERFFPNPMFIIHHFNHLTQHYFYPEIPVFYENQQEKCLLVFFCLTIHKNNT